MGIVFQIHFVNINNIVNNNINNIVVVFGVDVFVILSLSLLSLA